MKTKFLLVLGLFSYIFTQAQNSHVHYNTDPFEVRFVKDSKITTDHNSQAFLRSTSAWQDFKANNGNWNVRFNESSAMPHRAFGEPIQGSGANEHEVALNFIQNDLSLFGIDQLTLDLVGISSNEKHSWVNFKQFHNEMEVLFSKMVVKVTPDHKVIMFGADVFNDIDIPVSAAISHQQALQVSTDGLQNITFQSIEPTLSILPIENNGSYMFHLVYTTEVHTMDEHKLPSNYYAMVNAITGDILYRQNKVLSCGPECGHESSEELVVVSAAVTGTGFLTDPTSPESELNMPNVELTIGGTTYNADANGELQTTLTGPVTAEISLQGLYSTVVNDQSGQTPTFTTTLMEGNNQVTFDLDANINEISAYHSVNAIHDYMKLQLPSFNGMDFSLQTNVDINDQTCNAFYNGTSINFYVDQNSGDCVALSKISDVVYHEYGHGINDNFYGTFGSNFQNGAMNEGYADVWGFAPNEDPILANGLNPMDPDDFIRRYDIDPKVYPEDIIGEVHADGEIIAGAWWDLYVNFGNDMDATMELFAMAYPGLQATVANGNEGQAFFDVLVDALQADDDDGDLTNGTPNSDAITSAFAIHGITLISNADLVHDDVLFAPIDEGILIEAELDLDSDFIDFLQAVRMYYKVNDDADWTVVDLDNVGGDNYETTIPGQPLGTVIKYYLTALDINDIEASTLPIAANKISNANIPYFIMIGYEEMASHDSDDNADWGDWETGLAGDNATTGIWEENVPIGSDGGTVAPDEQNTDGGELCFLTGQSNNPGDGIGVNDVDGGTTTLRSPEIDLSGMTNPTFSYYRWYTNSPPSGANPGEDWWQGYISDDGGSTWVKLDQTKQSDASWRRFAFRVQDYLDITDQFMMRFNVSDSLHPGQNLDGGSLIEGAMDDIILWEQAEGIGFDEQVLEAEINLFPNPTVDVLTISIEIENADRLSIEVINSLGQIVQRKNLGSVNGSNNFDLNVSDLRRGVYQLRFINGNGSVTKHFTKQ